MHTGPAEAIAADADAVAQRLAVTQDQIEPAFGAFDDDCAGCLLFRKTDNLAGDPRDLEQAEGRPSGLHRRIHRPRMGFDAGL